MSSRFEERLRSGPPIVADGGMGTLISGAVPRLRCPEEANLRAPESVVALHASFIRAGAELIETNTFGANRRKLAAHFLEDDFERINSSGVRLAREAREVSGADVFIAGSIGPSGEVERFDLAEQSQAFSEQAQILEGRGVDLLMLETFFDLEELVAAIEAVRGVSSLPDRRADDLRRGRADTRRRLCRGGGRAARRARRRCRRRKPQRRPGGRAERARRDAAGRARAGGAPERRPREPRRIARRLPARDAGLLRRVRGAGAATRRRHHRRLLRHDAGADRRDQDRDRRGSRAGRPARRPRARAGRRRRCSARRDRPGEDAARAGVRRLRPARSAARRQQQRAHGGEPGAQGVRQDALRRRERQPARAGPDERDHGVRRDRAHLRDRDDSASDDARHVGRGARVAPARRPRGGSAQHPRGHGRPARGGRLPGCARRLRGRRDRADAPDLRAQPR